MKGKPFAFRLNCAIQGFLHAYRLEPSFRFQALAAFLALASLAWIRPRPLWFALIFVMVCLVLAAELVNTAVEHMLDGIHPGRAEFVRIAKDCAAASVLVLSLAAVVTYMLMLVDRFSPFS